MPAVFAAPASHVDVAVRCKALRSGPLVCSANHPATGGNMSTKRRPILRLRRQLIRGLLGLERLESREAPGSLLASALGGDLFKPFTSDPFSAASQVSLVSQNKTSHSNP